MVVSSYTISLDVTRSRAHRIDNTRIEEQSLLAAACGRTSATSYRAGNRPDWFALPVRISAIRMSSRRGGHDSVMFFCSGA